MIKAAVVILNWNGVKLLEQFLPSVVAHSSGDAYRVVVADNGSSDTSVEFLKTKYPSLHVIQLDKNYGFAEGYNKAIQQVDAEYVVLLNSDVETTENWLDSLILYMDAHPHVVAAQPKIRSYHHPHMFEYAGAAGGFIDRYGYPFCRGRILEVLEEDQGQYDEPIPIFWATGAALCIRRDEYLNVGGLDPRFFAHMEEIDLCWRLQSRGKRLMCIPESVVYHVGGASLSKDNPKKMYLNFRNNLLMLYKNLPQLDFMVTFLIRFFFDFMAYLHLIYKGEFKSARAVREAYRDFKKMCSSYKVLRNENMSKTTVKRINTMFRKSILLQFYLFRKKTYRNLYSK